MRFLASLQCFEGSMVPAGVDVPGALASSAGGGVTTNK